MNNTSDDSALPPDSSKICLPLSPDKCTFLEEDTSESMDSDIDISKDIECVAHSQLLEEETIQTVSFDPSYTKEIIDYMLFFERIHIDEIIWTQSSTTTPSHTPVHTPVGDESNVLLVSSVASSPSSFCSSSLSSPSTSSSHSSTSDSSSSGSAYSASPAYSYSASQSPESNPVASPIVSPNVPPSQTSLASSSSSSSLSSPAHRPSGSLSASSLSASSLSASSLHSSPISQASHCTRVSPSGLQQLSSGRFTPARHPPQPALSVNFVISSWFRARLVEWSMQLRDFYSFSQDVISHSIYLFDRMCVRLSKFQKRLSKAQGMVCMLSCIVIACKVQEVSHPPFSELVGWLQNVKLDARALCVNELSILRILLFDISPCPPTIHYFVRILCSVLSVSSICSSISLPRTSSVEASVDPSCFGLAEEDDMDSSDVKPRGGLTHGCEGGKGESDNALDLLSEVVRSAFGRSSFISESEEANAERFGKKKLGYAASIGSCTSKGSSFLSVRSSGEEECVSKDIDVSGEDDDHGNLMEHYRDGFMLFSALSIADCSLFEPYLSMQIYPSVVAVACVVIAHYIFCDISMVTLTEVLRIASNLFKINLPGKFGECLKKLLKQVDHSFELKPPQKRRMEELGNFARKFVEK
ncbi:hypothetical protein ADUPG1_011854 [Aduncisulcus paluster]|uniref:Cyclin N-terminal domain-containing protein n=1 Tax=Aduncisulcus paluster TaxID=2918883 RepID=A0ABQ5JXF5_9EUKA|nr:hypothetical protein ADUPG1_011854 [Aduncisulcus paluster]